MRGSIHSAFYWRIEVAMKPTGMRITFRITWLLRSPCLQSFHTEDFYVLANAEITMYNLLSQILVGRNYDRMFSVGAEVFYAALDLLNILFR